MKAGTIRTNCLYRNCTANPHKAKRRSDANSVLIFQNHNYFNFVTLVWQYTSMKPFHICYCYVGTVNGPTSITRLGVLKM